MEGFRPHQGIISFNENFAEAVRKTVTQFPSPSGDYLI